MFKYKKEISQNIYPLLSVKRKHVPVIIVSTGKSSSLLMPRNNILNKAAQLMPNGDPSFSKAEEFMFSKNFLHKLAQIKEGHQEKQQSKN